MKWNKFSEVKPKSGEEVLMYLKEHDCEVYQIGAYFKAGETLDEFVPFEGATPEQRFLNMLRGKGMVVVAEEEGVYVKEDLGTGNLEYNKVSGFTHWQELPEPPEVE